MPTLRLRGRLAAAFGVLLALQLVVAGAGLQRLGSLREMDARTAQLVALRSEVAQWSALTRLNVVRAVTLAKAGSPPALAGWMDGEMKQTTARISELQAGLDRALASPEEKSLLAAIGGARKAYIDLRSGLLRRLAQPEQAAEALAEIDSRLLPAANAYLAALEQLTAHADRGVAADQAARDRLMASDAVALPILTAVAALLGALMAWLLARSILRPLDEARGVAARIAGGDLTRDVPAGRRDEMGELLADMAGMQDALRAMVGGIRTGTDSVGAATSQIATGNQDLSARTERAASNLQQASATLAQLSDAMHSASASAGQAQALAEQAVTVARRGGEVVAEVVHTMAEINAGSSRISEITAVIDGIAFQTNMLALNAAVEAARAGEQGRGFAVVAAEVRGLAGRCAGAAREIRELIATSVDKVEAGSRLVGSAGSTMEQIQHSVRQVTEAVGGISAAAGSQASGIGEVNQAVAQLDEMTQQNAALVEEAAAAASSLHGQAASLGRLVAGFRTPLAAA